MDIKLRRFLIIFLIFIITISLRFLAISQKTYIHLDEPYVYYAQAPLNLSPDGKYFKLSNKDLDVDYLKPYKNGEMRKALFGVKDNTSETIIRDLKGIQNYNVDNTHTNLYYSIFRLYNSFGYESDKPLELIKHGLYLNIFFFILEFFFMYKLLSLIKNDTKFISMGLFFGLISTGTISNTIFLRPYAMMEMLFVLASYFTVDIIIAILKDKNISYIKCVMYSIGFSLFILTGFISLLYCCMIAITLFTLCIIKKRKQTFFKLILIIICAVSIVLLIYPKYFYLLFNNDHSFMMKHKVMSSNNKQYYQWLLSEYSYIDFLFYKPIIYLFGLLLVLKHYINDLVIKEKTLTKEENKLFLFLIIFGYVEVILLTFILPFPGARFMFPAFPIIALIIAYLLLNYRKSIIIFFMFSYLFLTILPIFHNNNYSFIENLHANKDLSTRDVIYDLPLNNYYSDNVLIVRKRYSYIYLLFTRILDENINLYFGNDVLELMDNVKKPYLIFYPIQVNYPKMLSKDDLLLKCAEPGYRVAVFNIK